MEGNELEQLLIV